MRLTVADAISPSYFVAIAAVTLGFFREEGVEMEFVFTPPGASQALKDGAVDFFGGSPYTGLRAFPRWRGGKLLCALSHYTYWFLAVRSDIPCERGDVRAVNGLRLSAAPQPESGLGRCRCPRARHRGRLLGQRPASGSGREARHRQDPARRAPGRRA